MPREVTEEARRIASTIPSGLSDERDVQDSTFAPVPPRCPMLGTLDMVRDGKVRVNARGRGTIEVGQTTLELGLVEQLVDPSQTRAIASILERGAQLAGEGITLATILAKLEAEMDAGGLDVLKSGWHAGDLARPRSFEIATALNRLRGLEWVQRK